MHRTFLAAAFALATLSAGPAAAAPAAYKDPLDAWTLDTIRAQFGQLMERPIDHDLRALHEMFWQSPRSSGRKSAIPSEETGRGVLG